MKFVSGACVARDQRKYCQPDCQRADHLLFCIAAQIANVKLESLPSPVRIPQLKALMRDDCTIRTGLGALYGAFDAQAGMDGFMTV